MGTSKKDRSDRERDQEERTSSRKRRRDSGEEERESSSKCKNCSLTVTPFSVCLSLSVKYVLVHTFIGGLEIIEGVSGKRGEAVH